MAIDVRTTDEVLLQEFTQELNQNYPWIMVALLFIVIITFIIIYWKDNKKS